MTTKLTEEQCRQVRAVKAMMELHDAPHVTEEQALARALAIAAEQAYGSAPMSWVARRTQTRCSRSTGRHCDGGHDELKEIWHRPRRRWGGVA